MLTTPELITALERRGVLGPGDVARVRQLHENSPTEFVPRVLFKWLVSRGRVTLDEADRVLGSDPSLSAAEILEQVLGRPDAAADEDDDELYNEDTKELPGDAAGDAQLPPRGAAPFADSPAKGKQPLLPTPKSPAERKVEQPSAAGGQYGDLFDDLLSGEAATGGLTPIAGAKKKRRGTAWDSPLMLVGGGALLLLVIVGSFLTWRILRSGGDAAFAAAEESYRNAGYSAAVDRFDQFLDDYPTHRDASTAVVHRGLAKLRLAVEAGGDGSRAFTTAQEVLREVSLQEAFAASKGDLSALLPELAEKLAQTAIAKSDPALLAQAQEARGFVDKYGAANDAIAARLQQLDNLLLTAERRLARGQRLREAVAAINQAALARDLEKAAKARSTLLREFPDAAAEPTLIEATAALADVKRAAVRVIAENLAAETAEPASPILRKVTLTARRNPGASSAAGVAFAAFEGTLFAVSAADGRVLWTRAIGYDAGLPVLVDPTADAASPEGDVVLYDGVLQALVRLGTQDGKLRWRQSVEPGGRWTLDRERICVTLKNRWQLLETATGKLVGQVDFPTALGSASSNDPRGKVRYQLGDAEDLYVVSNDDLRCKQVFYLGHAPHSIDVPPTCVGPYVLTAENVGEQARLRLLEASNDGTGLTLLGERMLPGRVTSPPQVSQRIAAVVTDAGAAELFDLAGVKEGKPLEPIAKLAGGDERDVVRRHFFFRGTQLWIGGRGLTRYEFQAALGRLTLVRNLFPDRTTLQSPQALGNLMISVAQPIDFSLPRAVAAVDADQGAVVWESFPAPTPRGPPRLAADYNTWTVVTRLGGVYDIPSTAPDAAGTVQIIDAPTAAFAPGLHPADEARPAMLTDDAAVYLAEATDDAKPQPLLTVEPVGKSPRTVASTERGDWVGDPVAYRDGVLLASAAGSLQLVDPRSGLKKLEPFVPPQITGRRPSWSRINVVGEEVLVSDGLKLFRLGVETQPQPYLKARASVDLVRPTIPQVAAVEGMAYLVDGTGELTAYSLPGLKPGATWKTRGAGHWGPAAVGKQVFALAPGGGATGESQLLCLTRDGKLAWKAIVRSHCFVPIADGETLLVADESGDVLRLDAATGKEAARVKLGLPLSAEPVVAANRLILTTQAGELVWIAKP